MESQLQRISQCGRKDREETSISTQHAGVRDQQKPHRNTEEQESASQFGVGEVRTGFWPFIIMQLKLENNF